jgi:hypothetical protein
MLPRYTLCSVPLLLAVIGCERPLPQETDPAKGRETLKAALDTWVKGGAPADLKPVVVSDPDWADGHKLTRYEIDPDDGRAGVDLLLKVKLTLQKKDGKTQEKQVNYVVGTNKQTVVLRYQ